MSTPARAPVEGQVAPKRIAILGGGIAALTTAFELSNAVGWQNDFDITIHQLGWRLGGKCASGRNADHYQRIEEHGLHILLGFYDNAFRVLRACYEELGRPPGAPLATWQDAFKPHDYVVLTELVGDTYVPWAMNFPRNSGVPGEGGLLPTLWEMVEMILGWLKQLFLGSSKLPDQHPMLMAAQVSAVAHDPDTLLHEVSGLHDWLHHSAAHTDPATLGSDIDWRRIFVTLDLGFAAIKGLILSGALLPPFDLFALDTLDFRAWLKKYGATDMAVNSAYISGMYDLGFSLPGQVGAGTAINGILRMCWTYKGAVMWEMQAGMGDTIMGPLYEVLSRRGVKFEFFHRVDNLALSDDGTQIERITIGRQVTLPPGKTFQPLVDVKNLPCWPSEPDYSQLVQGDALKASGADLEDWWTAWPDPVPPLELVQGTDFDIVILGCSVAIFPYIAKELIAGSPAFAAMVNGLGTTQTQAAQLWMSKDLAGIGWTLPKPVLDGYAEPMDTWSDMTHLLVREEWPLTDEPKNLAYLCSPLPDDGPLPPRSQHGYAQKQCARVHANTLEWLEASAAGLWPLTRPPTGGFDYSLLVAPGNHSIGPARFDSQYWIATLNPSDRYVLALPNTVNLRLRTNGSGYSNLLMVGDYLRTGMNVGCVEAATMGGMQASQLLCGRPKEIIGDPTP